MTNNTENSEVTESINKDLYSILNVAGNKFKLSKSFKIYSHSPNSMFFYNSYPNNFLTTLIDKERKSPRNRLNSKQGLENVCRDYNLFFNIHNQAIFMQKCILWLSCKGSIAI